MGLVNIFLLIKKFAERLKFPLTIFLFVASSCFLMMCTFPEKPVPSQAFAITDEERGWLREFFTIFYFASPELMFYTARNRCPGRP